MPTLTEEIKKVLNIYYWNHNQNPATKDLLSIIQSTVKGCVREKIDIDNRDKLHMYEGDEGQYWYDKGINDTIDTITSNLKEKGLL